MTSDRSGLLEKTIQLTELENLKVRYGKYFANQIKLFFNLTRKEVNVETPFYPGINSSLPKGFNNLQQTNNLSKP